MSNPIVSADRIKFEDKVPVEDVFVFPNLNQWETKTYKTEIIPRLVKTPAGIFFDLREKNEGANFTGYTKRGLRLNLTDIRALIALLPKVETMLKEKLKERREEVQKNATPSPDESEAV